MKAILTAAVAVWLAWMPTALSQTGPYPGKSIRILNGFPPGSSGDSVGRLLAPKLAAALGQSVVVENVTGAAGNLATERVVRAPADGYTLLLGVNPQIVINPSLYRLSYDPARDLAPISQIYVTPHILVINNTLPVNNVQELVFLAKLQAGGLTFASGGGGSTPHIAAELFKSVVSADIRHIPYKGVVAAMPDLLSGRVSMMFGPVVVVLPAVREGRLRALAVTSLKRSSAAPDLPTLAESGYAGFDVTLWGGLLAPSGTPVAVVGRLHSELVKVLALPDVRARLTDIGMDAIGNSPEEFAEVIRTEASKWTKLIRESAISAD
jgi:tripartite-type tricarboxylate transporter receptor subunit TctC